MQIVGAHGHVGGLGPQSSDRCRQVVVYAVALYAVSQLVGVEIVVSPAFFGSPAVRMPRVFGRSWGGFFSDFASTASHEHVWGEGGTSWAPRRIDWPTERVSWSYGQVGS